MSEKSQKLDEAAELAIDWAIQTLKQPIAPDDPYLLKKQQIKAQAASLVGQLKARVDPSAMRGNKGDFVGKILEDRLKAARLVS